MYTRTQAKLIFNQVFGHLGRANTADTVVTGFSVPHITPSHFQLILAYKKKKDLAWKLILRGLKMISSPKNYFNLDLASFLACGMAID